MPKNLLIVESPAKARTIGKYLGKDFSIKASMGHVIDLPVREFGIDLDDDFTPKYVVMKGKAKILQELKKAAASAETVYLAPDPDREGEAIAWHIANTLLKANPKAKIHRVLFNEITKAAIQKAVKAPLKIDMNKVEAQQARRILDRIVGYKISPILWKAVYRGLSAGRVQSVALRLICEREAAREIFKPQEYWTLEARVKKEDGREFGVKLHKVAGKDPELGSQEAADNIVAAVKLPEWTVGQVSKRSKKRNPYAPFITSTLQQEAARRLHFSASKTMRVAQELYEGLDIGDTSVGLITYMRTDSTRLSNDARAAAVQYITGTFGPDYLPAKSADYKVSDSAQDAHEAIRPTNVDPAFEPERIKKYLREELFRLYDLVWKRFFASQMAPAEYDSTTVDIPVKDCLFRAVGSVLKFDGFTRLYREETEEENTEFSDRDLLLPEVAEGERLKPLAFDPEQHFTQPPPRYSEASLVKELEAQGIGRPSTYAQIIDTLKRRAYVEVENRRFTASQLGRTVSQILVQEFPDLFNVSFTAKMEGDLDKVESGENRWTSLLKDFYTPLSRTLAAAQDKVKTLKKSLEAESGKMCGKCGKPMVIKWGRNGRFMACSGYPECKSTSPLPGEIPDAPVEQTCPKCGSAMVVKRWNKSRFLGCSRYPDCRSTLPYPTGVKCPEPNCKGYLAERYSQRGKLFFSCSEYPNCKYALWNKPVNTPCPVCQTPFMVEHFTKAKGAQLKCLKCKHEMSAEKEEVE